MKTYAQQTIDVLENLGEEAQITVLRFAKFLAVENYDDVKLYDEAKSEDDGYRISSNDLRAKYGI